MDKPFFQMKKKTIFTEMKGNVISRFTLAQSSGCSGVYSLGFGGHENIVTY